MGKAKMHKLVSLAAFLILILLSSMIFVSYTNIQDRTIRYQQDKTESEKSLEMLINTILVENEQKATIQANEVKENITEDLLTAYKGNTKQLQDDMDAVQNRSDTPLLNIISNDIKDKYLNTENDANDIFVIGKWVQAPASFPINGAVIGDKSLDCSKDGELRTFDVEITKHYNKDLATSAITRIINQDTEKPIFWEFLQSKDPNHIHLTYADLKGLNKVIEKEGIVGLKTYEVLNPVYLNPKEDILGVEDVDNTGNKNSNHKIIIVQGFSLYDAIMTNHSDQVQYCQDVMQQIEKSYQYDIRIQQIETILLCALVLVVFLSVVKIQNQMLD